MRKTCCAAMSLSARLAAANPMLARAMGSKAGFAARIARTAALLPFVRLVSS
jgi:hypothetical protein